MKFIALTKTDYILFRECPKNLWYKIHKPDVYSKLELSEFEKLIIETGNEVELVARKLFCNGILVKGRGEKSQQETKKLLLEQQQVIFQPEFLRDGFRAAVDILELQNDGTYNIYEVKSTNSVDEKTHYHDLSFQINLLKKCGVKVNKAYVIHLNPEYIRLGELNIVKLFKIVDVSDKVAELIDEVEIEMVQALKYILTDEEPKGFCKCIYKGRSNHCSTFKYSNPQIPEYGVHDISRIGISKATLQELVDVNIFDLKDVPEHIKLSVSQRNQIDAHVFDKILIDKYKINEELDALIFPLYFLDYETFPSTIPRFDGFSSYKQIPFQYSLHILDSKDADLKHLEFLFTDSTDPSLEFVKSLQENIGDKGSIIVWNKKFECKINEEIAERNPNFKLFIDSINIRVYDLMDIFYKQYYVHKDFKGRVSIKNILPVLVPELSYKSIEIQEGGMASQNWNKINNGDISELEKEKIIKDLKIYCKMDTYAMYSIWKFLSKLTN